ncbi:PAS domain S-box protein [Methylobacterium sp. HMF5984]|uniref:PAS domain S-box protein n=1 Tax=Methylobacterium sp. HMF5984 TaxID=3367370 RepID=UPI003851BA02
MTAPEDAARDPARLAALDEYGILDTPAEQGFDDIVLLASRICGTPVALVSLAAGDRQWFKARIGFDPCQTPLDQSVCVHALVRPSLLVIPDLAEDPRTRDNPLVTGEPRLRFYAGARLETPEGVALGTLCVIDGMPRPEGLTPEQADSLQALARQVMAQMELRRSAAVRDDALRRVRETETRHRQILDSAIDYAMVTMDLDARVTGWSAGAVAILGWSEAEMCGRPAHVFFTEEDVAAGIPEQEMKSAREKGGGTDERWHLRKDGSRIYASGEMMPLQAEDGGLVGYLKILRDRTGQHLAGKALEESEARLRQAQAAGGVGLFTVDMADNVLTPTPELCRLYGLPERASYPATALEGLVVPEDAHLVSTAETRRLGGPPRDVEYRIRRPDTGELRWIARKGEIERDPSGRPVRFSGVARDVTEQRTARDALAVSEERYRTLFDSIDEGFCVIRFLDGPRGPLSDYVHVEANPAFAHHLGIADAVGRTLREIIPDEGADGWLGIYGKVLHSGEPVRFQRQFAPNGRHLEVAAHRVEPAGRREVAVLFTDITARKEAEAALRASEAVARENVQRVQLALAAGAIIGTWFWDLPNDRFTVDEAFACAFGLDPALGRDGIPLARIVATVHPDDQAGLAEAIAEAIARGGPYAHQYRVRRADGNYYWLEANGRVEHAADGTPLSFPGVLLDVDARRAVEAERDRVAADLRALNETLAHQVAERTQERDRIWHVSRDMLGVADAAGVWISINPAWHRILGWDYHDIVGKTSEWLEHPEDRERTRTEVARLATGGLTLAFENRFRARDGGYRTLSWTAVPVDGLLYCVSRDVTEEKERAATLLQAEEALRQSQKLEAVGQLTGGVAHDFNNLLTVIKSSTDLLKRPDLPEERRDRYIGAISDTVDRAAKLTGQLLAFARRQALRPEVFDVGRSVRAIGEMVGTLTGARIAVSIQVGEETCHINADPSQFDTALVNMAVNARDAMDGEGRLDITVEAVGVVPAMRSHPALVGDYVRIALSDTGSGIPAEQIDRIFEPFFTTKGVGQGTGLGLSQVFGFAKQSGGEVKVESEVGRGTTFALYLPRAEGIADRTDEPASVEAVLDGRGTCVLVVEDNRDVGTFSTQTLEELGYGTHWVANADEALATLAEKPGTYDVVFSDVVMPGMNGVDLGREVRRLYPGLPVVLTSGYSHVLAQESDHGFELLQKPYSVEALGRILHRAASKPRSRKNAAE